MTSEIGLVTRRRAALDEGYPKEEGAGGAKP